ncbi:efflux RND transporter periplasmic adaptor subunit [Desulfosarcina ovata]|uniref:RND transporter n=1 Tax=Desulfosarcina ovata subsp. ovata TaxID=2752305 RepID=A0A5K8AL47_9BACT|nr:efflux RND transporter periplasmic adaptor subunit [Desulfosarcina ovata]BBO93259.1 RND transporter [Desulfosarcina ovata subsp. ovata]
MRKLVLPALLAFALLIFSVQCSEKIEPGTTPVDSGPAVSVRVVDVRSAVQPILYEAVGTVRARLSATVSSKLMGTIQAFNVKEGDDVKKGDLLVRIDDRQVAAQLDQARAALAEAKRAEAGAVSARIAAEAGAQRARLSFERNRTMLEGGAITQEMFETVDAQHKQARASLAQAKAMVEAARFRVKQAQAAVEAATVARKDAHVLAPFDGQVTAKQADAGALASPGMPLLTLEREGGYRVDLVVPETHIRAVKTGLPVAVRIPAVSEIPIRGTVDVIVPSGDQGSRTFVVQVGIPVIDGLRSGMFARVPLTIGEQKILRIPRSAVVHEGQLTGVFIVDAGNIARFRLIRTGRDYDDSVEVISGIEDETRLVAQPPAQLSNGAAVEFAK